MQKGILKTKKGYTASEINFYVDDDGDIRYSYEVEPIEPKYKCGDILDLGDGDLITLVDWDGGINEDTFYGVGDKLGANINAEKDVIIDSGWKKRCVKGLATIEQVFQYYKAFKDAGYEWDAEKMEFVEYAWKPEKGTSFFIVCATGLIDRVCHDSLKYAGELLDNNNYFRTKEAAQAAADQIKEVLKNAPKE